MHISVLKKEVLEYLDPRPNENFIDCTINGGGHAFAILEKIKPRGKLLGIEADENIYNEIEKRRERTEKSVGERLILVNENFINLKKIISENKFSPVSGIIFDLGFSSWHIEQSGKGFSFSKNEFLDMRYSSGKEEITAWEIVNRWPKESLEMIFKNYGEERFSRRIAEEIAEQRKKKKIDTTFDLVEVIGKAVPARFKKGKIHFATKVFQSLRIEVNEELENIKKTLPQAIDVLEEKGRIAAISFHSLEDRIVKHFFKDSNKDGKLKILTKKPIMAGFEEMEMNPRSRSAKLRAAEIV